MRIGIVTGGTLEERWFLQDSKNISHWIVADHGMDAAKRLSLVPECIVGDFDSVSTQSLLYYQSFPGIRWEKHNPVKDETDTELAIRLAIEWILEAREKEGQGLKDEGLGSRDDRTSLGKPGENKDEIVLYGATGTRLDHVLGNIHCLEKAFHQGIRAEIRDPYNRIYLVNGAARISRKEQYGEYVSFVPFAGEVRHLTLSGFFYPLKDVSVLPGNSLLISNRIVEEEAVITCEGTLICFETRDRL